MIVLIVLEEILSDTRTAQEVAQELCDNYDAGILELFIIQPLMMEVHSKNEHAIDPGKLLYGILCADRKARIHPKTVLDITEILFKDSDTPFCDAIDMKRLLETPYGSLVSNSILFQFLNHVTQRSPRYVYAAAAIMALKWQAEGLDVIDAAKECILKGIESGGILLGIAVLSLICRNRLYDGCLACQESYLDADEELLNFFILALTKERDCLYPYIVTTICDMVLLRILNIWEIMNSTLLQATMDTLEDTELGTYAEELLSLLPFQIDSSEAREHYDARYEESLVQSDPLKMLQLFRVVTRLHCRNAEKTAAEWKRLTIRLAEIHKLSGMHYDLRLIALYRYTSCELAAHFHREWLTATPESAMHILLAPLPLDRKAHLEKLSQEACVVVDDANLAAEIIVYCHNAISDPEGYDLQKASALINRADLRCGADEGTVIAVRWFYLLCRLGEGSSGIEFYNRHRKILDRPRLYKNAFACSKQLDQDIADMAEFFRRDSRLIHGMHLAQLSRNDGILNAFRDMAEQEQNEDLLCIIEHLGYVFVKKDIMEEALHFARIAETLRRESMTGALLFGFGFYYDDTAAVFHALKSNPMTCAGIMAFGYGGIKDVVLDALPLCGCHLMGMLPYAPVRHDHDVLMDALLVMGLGLNDE